MLLTIEKAVALKGIDIFSETPDNVLVSLAAIVEDVDLVPGETFITEGSLDNSMYLILEGEIEVHSENKSLVKLGPGTSVGELALLDPNPRSANVTATQATRALRIEKAAFDEAMDDRPEIARGVIRALCRRIRNQKEQLLLNID